ncbi:HNH endonuclease [Mesobacillus harenae]|uniref:HNH endonuclease n=1 Tax=Mesobacillus harenae TaxID=2213203 RepID=UPI0015800F29|nr:HNH endonuclease [Mesobacillus harenae]
MTIFRKVGKGIGQAAGGVIGGGVKLVGKKAGSPWVEEVGDGIKVASTVALENAGQFIDGAVKGTYGAFSKNEQMKQDGFGDLKDSTGRTIKGIGQTITYTVDSGRTTYQGLKEGDKEKSMQGVKNLGKVAAISTLAIGVVDFIDGADSAEAKELDARNSHLAGDIHPETGVPFMEKSVELPSGEVVTGSFPIFDPAYQVQLPEEMYLQSDHTHFSYANVELYEAIHNNPSAAAELGLTNQDVQGLSEGTTPSGYTWHHHEEVGVLQLVEQETHHNTGHTGGRELWGGGAEYR